MKFTDTLWHQIQPIYNKILEHPFNQEFIQGSLSREIFQFYLKQDSLYLLDFSRALALIGAKSTSPNRVVQFLEFAQGAIAAERGLHEQFFAEYEIEVDVPKAPGCLTYTNFLLSTAALQPDEEAIAAVLPCFWIYQEVGRYIAQHAVSNHPYQKWIDLYSGEDFAKAVASAIAIADEVAEATTPAMRERMVSAFTMSSRLEWVFWDSAYRKEQWPV
jgi:thiaminase/transcriptional activator TenA